MPVRTKKPSVKTLECAFPGKGKALRELLDSDDAVNANPAVIAWERECFNPPRMAEKRMVALDNVLETCGVEYIARGTNAKSPAITYCNAGDSYATTILRVNGVYRVGCWGDIVERGNYQ